jgi:Sec-independent protein translocase protein TatA
MDPLFILGMINAAELAIVVVILLIVLNWDKFK